MQVSFDVVDGDQGHAQRLRDALGGVEADNERRRESRSVGHGNGVDRVALHRVADDLGDLLDMGARGDLRNDAAIRLMKRNLRVDDIRENLVSVPDHRRGSLVATGFNAQDIHFKDLLNSKT